PSRAGILHAQGFCLFRNAFGIIAKSLIRKMPAHRPQAALVELGLELLGSKVIRSCQFDIRESHVAYFVERAWHVFRELISQTVELQTQRPFKGRPSPNSSSHRPRNK